MNKRIVRLPHLLAFLLWLVPVLVLAAPPAADNSEAPGQPGQSGDQAQCLNTSLDLVVRVDSCNAWLGALPAANITDELVEKAAKALEQLERKAKKDTKETKKKVDKLRWNVERLHDSRLRFLSGNEVERIGKVESFEVVVEPVEDDTTANDLAEACVELVKEIPTLHEAKVAGQETPGALLQGEVMGGSAARLASAIKALRSADESEIVSQVQDVAQKLVIVGLGIDQLCNKVTTGTLNDDDIALLRKIFSEDAQTILRYQQLLNKSTGGKTVAKLAVELIGAEKDIPEDRKKFVVAVLSADLSGTPRSSGTPVNLGAVATTAFEGLAEFLIDRAKEEGLQYIRDTLVKQVCSSDIEAFVPKTCKVMKDLDASMALSAVGKMLHAAVLDDLELMPDRVLVLAWMRAPEVAYSATLVRLALPLLEDAELRKNPLDYAISIHSMPETDCEKNLPVVEGSGDVRCAETLAYLRLASVVLRASASNMETTTSNSTYIPAYLPFLTWGMAFHLEVLFAELPPSVSQRIARELKWTWDSETRELKFSSTELAGLAKLAAKSVPLAGKLEATIISLSATNVFGESNATPENVLVAARSAIVGVAEIAQIAAKLDTSRHENDPLQTVLDDSRKLVAMSDAIRGEDWGATTLALFDDVLEMLVVHEDGTVEVKVSETVSVVFDELGRYLPLFVEIANAKSSADVKAALEAAFPAGGYRLKYRQPAVALNGFLGIYGGGLYLPGASQQLTGEAAMFAPIGVETTWPVKSAKRKAWHLGFLLAVVDLGAITTSKFLETEVAEPPKDDMGNEIDGDVITAEEPSKFNIAALLSPGAYFTVGVAESPFSLGLGASVNPFVLQQVERSYVGGEVDSQSQSYLTAVRFGAFLAVDITMVAFGRKGRNQR